MHELQDNLKEVDPHDAPEILKRAITFYGDELTMATSFQLGGLVLLDMIAKMGNPIRVFSIDTGRLPEETLACAENIRDKYDVQIDWFFPQHEAVESLEREKGLFSFRESVDERKFCCNIRKVEPLSRALQGYRAWITGRREDQSETRSELTLVEPDPVHTGVVKINPLAAWTQDELWAYVKEHRVPYNRLYDEGYLSIGCACCTRPAQADEDERAGRWWWENPEHKECGLHIDFGQGEGI